MYNTKTYLCRLYKHKHDDKRTQVHMDWQCWEVQDKGSITSQTDATDELKEQDNFRHNQNLTLHQACKQGNLVMVKYISSRRQADIKSRGKRGRTPIMVAARNGHVAVFDYLVSQGSNLSEVDDKNNTLLHVACMGGNTDIIQKLMIKGKCDQKGQYEWTPVMLAAARGQKRVFDTLVSKGCDIAVVDRASNTILHLACKGGGVDIVNYILHRQLFHIDSKGYDGMTPVMTAAENGHKAVVNLLIRKGCNITATDQHRNTILHSACNGGNVDMVKYILSLKIISIESRGWDGFTPVMTAALKGHSLVVGFLVRAGCDVEAVDQLHNNMLHVVCLAGNVPMIKYILSGNLVNIESKGHEGRTPMLSAASRGKLSALKFLLGKGCNVTAVDNAGNNLLHVACISGNVDMINYILSLKLTDLESSGFLGRTPVMTAAWAGRKEVVKFLLSRGCNAKPVDRTGNNILHAACLGGNVDMVKYILSNKLAHIESWGFAARTPVLMAVETGNRGVVELLIRHGCNLDVVDHSRNNILHAACRSGLIDMVQFILSLKRFSIESRGHYGMTPLMFAVSYNHREVIDLLLMEGSNPKAIDYANNNILHIACSRGHVDLVKYILSKDLSHIDKKGYQKRTPVMSAVYAGQTRVVKYLVSEGCNLKAVDYRGNNMLHAACDSGSIDMVEFVLSLNMHSIESRGEHGFTPVMIAARKDKDVVELLVREGSNAKAKDRNGNTMLHVACLKGNGEMVKYIVSKHLVGIESKGYAGKTPVIAAAETGCREVVDFLIRSGCYLNAVDDDGNSVLHAACYEGQVDMVKYLLTLRGIDKRSRKNKSGWTPAQLSGLKNSQRIEDCP